MASLQEIKDKIRVANEIGRANLTAKGVSCSANATTCEIMCLIADCQTGSNVSDGTNVKFGADATYDERYAVLSESLNEIARLTQTMAGTSKAMTLADIIYWLGRVIYIPQGNATSALVCDDLVTASVSGILPNVAKGYANSTVIGSFTTSAV